MIPSVSEGLILSFLQIKTATSQAENTLLRQFCFCHVWKCKQHEMETKSSEIAIEMHCCAKRSLWLFTMGGESIWFNQCGFSRKSQENDDVWTFGTTETSLKPPAAMNAILMSCSLTSQFPSSKNSILVCQQWKNHREPLIEQIEKHHDYNHCTVVLKVQFLSKNSILNK